jgi:hypothetical protein
MMRTVRNLEELVAQGVCAHRNSNSRVRTGRLHQVEYAIEAINNAGTCVGILCKDGIVLAGGPSARAEHVLRGFVVLMETLWACIARAPDGCSRAQDHLEAAGPDQNQ